MSDEILVTPLTNTEPDPFIASLELQIAVDKALKEIKHRSFSERHPELGKMVNCRVCSRRHREHERKCEQVFTYRVGDYELYRMDEEKNELVPDYRTAIRPDEKPTMKQYMGAAAYAKKRFHPHLSKVKLLFIERTRKIFEELGFALDDKDGNFQKNLQRARVLAARQIRRERRISSRRARLEQRVSRRINRG
jgi:hypothetical protein